MDLAQFAQYGIGGLAIGALVYLGGKALDAFREGKQTEKDQVIENNTAAMNNLTSFLQVTLTKNEVCMDQVVENTKHIPVMANQVNNIWEAVKSEK